MNNSGNASTRRSLRLSCLRHLKLIVGSCLSVSVLVSCGGGGTDNGGTVVDPPVTQEPVELADVPATELTAAVPTFIGENLSSSVNGLGNTTFNDSIVPGADADFLKDFISDDDLSFIDTSLGLNSSGAAEVSRDGNRITVNPDDQALCAERTTGVFNTQQERERCQTLMSDLRVQVDPVTRTEGTVTYLFQDDVVATIDYGETKDSFELDLSGIKTFKAAERALDPDNIDPLPEIYKGIIRVESTTTNTTPGAEAGAVSISIKEAVNISGTTTVDSVSVAAGDIFTMAVDAGKNSGNINMNVGAVNRRTDSLDGVIDYDLKGWTANVDLVENSGKLIVDDVSLGNGPFTIAVDDSEVMNLRMDKFGYEATPGINGGYMLDGGLNISTAYTGLSEDVSGSPALDTMLGIIAPTGTSFRKLESDSWFVGGAGPVDYTYAGLDPAGNPTPKTLTVNSGECIGTVGVRARYTFLVSENAAEGEPMIVPCGTEDEDNDTILDTLDNCPNTSNTNQSDSDNDGIGDVCDFFDDNDNDNDSIKNQTDNCKDVANTDQADLDNDGIGDVCDDINNSDTDSDGVLDTADNCPAVANSDQANQDGDNLGDVCDDDKDGDTVANGADNCPDNSNTDQADQDGDGIGNVCDTSDDSDSDNDTVLDSADNCPAIPNGDQANLDGDSFGDVCDDDRDGDTILNTADNCPINSNFDQADLDNDGQGDVCDNANDTDSDNDTVLDSVDNCPAIPNGDQANLDGDSFGDVCDDDIDGDTILNAADNCPINSNFDQADLDNDGQGDVCDNANDADSDNDTVLDTADNCPAIANTDQANLDGDSLGDVCDDDRDGDTILNTADNCPINSNFDQADLDNDGIGDVCDNANNTDSDNDTVLDTADNCPAVPNTDQANLDGDSFGDVCDDDIDGDAILNTADNCPINSNFDQADLDNDGTGDVCDTSNDSDSDNDTVLDTADNCPAIPNTDQANLDGDSFGDVCDDDRDGDTILNTADNCPVKSNTDQADLDNDSIGDVCDTSNDSDTDNDTVLDTADNCPAIPNTDQANQDGDSFGDVCDDDRDGDSVLNTADNCPTYPNSGQGDINSNGMGDHCECSFTAQIEAAGPWDNYNSGALVNTPNSKPTGCQVNSTVASGLLRNLVFTILNPLINPAPTYNIFYFDGVSVQDVTVGVSASLDEQRSCAILVNCPAEVDVLP